MLTVCIGYDYRESIAYHVLAHSIMRRASRPVRIIPLILPQLAAAGLHTRPRSPGQSTDFTYTRFLTPHLAEENSVSIFMDCDMLCLTDITALEDIAKADSSKDVFVVKHDYASRVDTKFLNQTQSIYPCKNWSSMMVFNGHRQPVKNLTPSVIDKADAMDLHQFAWAHSPNSVGSLHHSWNHLVGEYEPNPDARILHFTLGGPYFHGYDQCEGNTAWFAEMNDMLHRTSPSFALRREWL